MLHFLSLTHECTRKREISNIRAEEKPFGVVKYAASKGTATKSKKLTQKGAVGDKEGGDTNENN